MTRKLLLQMMAILLVVVPLLSLNSGEAHAATSRVAIIKSLKGTVSVKKAGGAKEFRAFARMSLNEGDVLSTSAGSSAVLQFANGTSEDDTMTVSANTTLTFSKLSDRSGTRTKISMWSGSAWIDVKSIANKNDEFTLETPTAIMGVRGTTFLAGVDPHTGTTFLSVFAGIVQAGKNSGPQNQSDSTDDGDGNVNVYPTQQVVLGEGDTNPEDHVSTIDLDAIGEMLTPEVIHQLLENKAAIDAELEEIRQQLIQQLENQGTADLSNLGLSGVINDEELQQLIDNINRMVGSVVTAALNKGVINQDELEEMLDQTNQQFDYSDDTLVMSERQRELQRALRELEEKRRQEQQQRQEQREQQNKALEELLQQTEEQRKRNEEQRERRRQQQLEEYERQLAEAEKERFERDRLEREAEAAGETSPSPGEVNPGVGSGGGSNPSEEEPGLYEQRLKSLELVYELPGPAPTHIPDAKRLDIPVEEPSYTLELPYLPNLYNDGYYEDYQKIELWPVSADPEDNIMVKYDGIPVTTYYDAPGLFEVMLERASQTIDFIVFPADGGDAQTFQLIVNRPSLPEGISFITPGITFHDAGRHSFAAELPSLGYEPSSFDFLIQTDGQFDSVFLDGDNPFSTAEYLEDASDDTTKAYRITMEDDDYHEFYLTVTQDGLDYGIQFVINRGMPVPDWNNPENFLIIHRPEFNEFMLNWTENLATVEIHAFEELLLKNMAYNIWIDAIVDVNRTKAVEYDSENGGYMLPLLDANNEYELHLSDHTGLQQAKLNLHVVKSPLPLGFERMELVTGAAPEDLLDGTRQNLIHHAYQDYYAPIISHEMMYAVPTVTGQVYGQLQMKVDPDQIGMLSLYYYSEEESDPIDCFVDVDGICSFDLPLLKFGQMYELELKVNWAGSEDVDAVYPITIFAGSFPQPYLDGYIWSSTYNFEYAGPFERVVYIEESLDEAGIYFMEDFIFEVIDRGNKLQEGDGAFWFENLKEGDILPIKVKAYDYKGLSEPVVFTLTLYNGGWGDPDALPSLDALEVGPLGGDLQEIEPFETNTKFYQVNLLAGSYEIHPVLPADVEIVGVYDVLDQPLEKIGDYYQFHADEAVFPGVTLVLRKGDYVKTVIIIFDYDIFMID